MRCCCGDGLGLCGVHWAARACHLCRCSAVLATWGPLNYNDVLAGTLKLLLVQTHSYHGCGSTVHEDSAVDFACRFATLHTKLIRTTASRIEGRHCVLSRKTSSSVSAFSADTTASPVSGDGSKLCCGASPLVLTPSVGVCKLQL